MRRRIRRALDLLPGLLLLAAYGCGGGSSNFQTSPPPPPPPPQPDFSIGFSINSVNLQQGSTSSPVNLSVTSLNGFTGSVQVTLTGLMNGVISNPVSPFNIAAGSSTPVLFSAATTLPQETLRSLQRASVELFRTRLISLSRFKTELLRAYHAPPMQERIPYQRSTIPPVSLTTGTSPTILATSSSSWPTER
jgi:hypothetical protein